MRLAHLHVSDQKNKGDVAIVLAVQQLLRQQFPDCKIVDFPVEFLRDGDDAKILEQINTCQLIIIGGGGIFYRWFLPFNSALIQAIKKPIVLYGVGYINELGAPELNQFAINSITELCRKCTLISVRDNKTKKWLTDNNIKADNIKVVGDPTIFLAETKPNLQLSDARSIIGLNLNYSGWLGFGKYKDNILSAYNSVINYYEGLGGRFIYCLHHPDERKIIPELSSQTLSVLDLSAGEQKYIYGTMNLLIGMMLHSAVLSFGSGTPFINVAYDLRNYSFAEYIEHPELIIDANEITPTKLLALCQKVLAEEAYYRQDITQRRHLIWQAQKKFLQSIKSLI